MMYVASKTDMQLSAGLRYFPTSIVVLGLHDLQTFLEFVKFYNLFHEFFHDVQLVRFVARSFLAKRVQRY